MKDSELSLQAKRLWKQIKFFSIVSGKLMRYRICSGVKQWQLVLPSRYHDVALEYVHSRMGHLGRDRSLELLRERYYWVGMQKSVAGYTTQCDRCSEAEGLSSTTSTTGEYSDMSAHGACLYGLPETRTFKGRCENILVITDQFTKYAQAYPTKKSDRRHNSQGVVQQFFCALWLSKALAQ